MLYVILKVAVSDTIFSLSKSVLNLDELIEYCAIVDKYGHIIASQSRMPPRRIVNEDNAERIAMQSAIRNFTTPSWAVQFGAIYYTATRHEAIISATVRISNNYLMIVSFDAQTSNFDEIIMQRIMPFIEKCRLDKVFDSQA